MKKLLSAILVIVMVAASLSFTVSAEDEFVITDGVLEKYNGSAAEVVIPDGVVALGDLAFDGNSAVEKIYVSDTVETVGYSSFHNCANLTELHLGASVNKLGDNAIWESYNLTVITVAEDNPYLAAVDNVVYSKDLTTLVLFPDGYSGEFVIPDHVTKVGDYSFFGCKKITSLMIPDTVTEIGSHGFWGLSGIESIDLPDGLTKIAEKTFCECTSLKSLYIPDGVKVIESRAIWDCKALETIHLPDSLVTIADNVFYACPLTSITIPAGTESIGNRAFIQCPSLEKIIFEGDAPSNTDKRFINKCDNAKIYYNSGASGFGGASFTSYGQVAFSDCETGHYYKYVSQADVADIPCGGYLKDLYKCARCEQEMLKSTDAVREHELVHHDAKDPTCTEPGNYEYDECLNCDYTTYEEIPAAGHDYRATVHEATCTARGYTEYVCSVCGHSYVDEASYTEPLDHDYRATVHEATCTERGYTEYVCSVCGHSYVDEATYVEPLGHDFGEDNAAETCARCGAKNPAYNPPVPQISFTDVKPGAFYAEAVGWALANGITKGTSDTTFSPGKGCTRAEVVTFLWRAAGEPEPAAANNPFGDVGAKSYYYKAVQWAVENNVTTGTSSTTFSPSATCTRAQIVTFLWRYNGAPKPESDRNPFTDVKKSAYFGKAVLWAVENGITEGTSKTKFSPSSVCTRGQVVTFLYRSFPTT